MHTTTLLVISLVFAPVTPKSGIASQYAKGVMAQVVSNRQSWGQLPSPLPSVDGFIAVLDCGRIGETWLLRPQGRDWETFLVTDCAGDLETVKWMQNNNILAEVDYPTAERWATIGHGIRVRVITQDSLISGSF